MDDDVRKPEQVFRDFRGRRSGIIKALTTDVEKFYAQCDPDETWEVNLPAEEVPPELPEPALGINFARDGMEENDWLALVAVHSDSWLLAVAFYFAARFEFNKETSGFSDIASSGSKISLLLLMRLHSMINSLPTVYEVVTRTAKPSREKTSNGSIKSSKSSSKKNASYLDASEQLKLAESQKPSKMQVLTDLDSREDEEEHENTLCGACGDNYAADEFWICCDVCEQWFHGKCVRITPAKAEHIKQYNERALDDNSELIRVFLHRSPPLLSPRCGSASFLFLVAMFFFRHLLLRSIRGGAASDLRSPQLIAALCAPSRHFAFSSAEEAAAERRRRKRRLRIEPPLDALRRDPNAYRQPRDPNAPRLPDSTSALVGPRLNLHNRVQSLIRGGDLEAASSTARHAVFSSVRPTVFTCNAITASMLRAGRLDDVVALFTFFFNQSNIVPNVVSYNILINAHCNAGRVDVALDVYRHILENAPFSPSYVTYRHLTKGLVDADRMQDAIDLLREMLNRGHGADSMVYNTIMAGFIDRGNMERALQFFDELRDRCLVYDGIVHSTLMEAYFKQGMDKEAMDSYQSLLDRQFKMIPATCNVLIETLLKHNKLAEAEAMFENMLNNHSPPGFTAINTDTYNLMVNQRFKEGKFVEAIETFHRQPKKPLIMDVGCFNNIIAKLCENRLLLEAQTLFDEMPEKSVNPDATTFRTLIDACFRVGRADDAMEFLEKMIKNSGESPGFRVDVEVYNMIFDGLVKAGRISQALKVFDKLWERGIRPNMLSYEVLVTALCNVGSLDRARDLFEQMLRSRINATSELSALLSDTFGKAGRSQEIEGLLGGGSSSIVVPQAQQVAV
ncbi:hypothetical protein ZIOFF_026051 [Zingiber officinale]|uniref:Zinc finger PHD-type domain-containing protein n=2 Tax=Zingiber officinale TaxID=94328 RepID=A0A8J5GYJ7_ZINOF|nr:hypothetical protein ZIOFF_026051 [Zingiber officinale]